MCVRVVLPWHTGVRSTLPLTETSVSTDTTSGGQLPGAGTRVHGDWLADDEAIGNELADGLARVCVGDFVNLVGVEPDLALSAANDGRSQALLGAKVDPIDEVLSVMSSSKRRLPPDQREARETVLQRSIDE